MVEWNKVQMFSWIKIYLRMTSCTAFFAFFAERRVTALKASRRV